MPGLISAILGSKRAMGALVAVVTFGGLTAFVEVEKHRAVAAAVAQYEIKTAAEHDRRQRVLDAAQLTAQTIATALAVAETHNVDQLQVISRLRATNDARSCIDSAGGLRVLQIGRSAGDRAGEPGRGAAGEPRGAVRQPR